MKLKKVDFVIAWMSASNVDDKVFEHPLEFDVHRKNNKRNFTFGIGPHFCLGAPLARLELNIALNAFLESFSEIRPEESFILEKNLAPSASGQSLTYLPLHVTR